MKDKVEITCSRMIVKFLMLLLMFCFSFLSVDDNVHAAERRTVRVAFFPMDGYHIVEKDGSYGGMDVEYLKEISNYTAWDFEYVECESWSDALEKLLNKEVDLGLTKAENAFFKGNYKNSLEQAISAINVVEPGIYKKLLDKFKD